MLKIEVAPAVLEHPEARTKGGAGSMARRSVLQDAVPNEVLRTILREATHRLNHELMDDEERQLLLDRIQRLRRKLGIVS